MATSTHARRAPWADAPGIDDLPDLPFEPLSDEQWAALERRAEEREKTPAQRRRELREESRRQEAQAREFFEDDEADRARRTERAGRTGAAVQRAGGSVARSATTAPGATLGILQGKRPATISAGVLGVLGYALVVNYLHGGWPQVKGWLAAKFANSPYTPAPAAPATTAVPAGSTRAVVVSFPSGAPVVPGQVA